jgi:hypothetical protein
MVAYQVTGESNPVDLVHAPGTVSHLELFWDIPEAASFIERLSSFARLIRFDKRGTGMSDRPLILWGTHATWTLSDDYPWGESREAYLAVIETLAEQGMTDEYLFGPGAGVGSGMSEEDRERIRRFWRSATTPGALAALERMNLDLDIRGVLPTIHVPTLVMNRTNDPVANVEAARDLASRIEGARFMEFAGNEHPFFAG